MKVTFMTMTNHSISQVLVRTVNTTLTSLIPVLAMLLFGGETLKDFAFAMVIGLVCGSYSSIAIAAPLYAMWKSKEPRYAKLAKKYGPEVKLFQMVYPDDGGPAVERLIEDIEPVSASSAKSSKKAKAASTSRTSETKEAPTKRQSGQKKQPTKNSKPPHYRRKK